MRSLLPGDSTPGEAMSPAATTTFSSLPVKHPGNDELFVDPSGFYAVPNADDVGLSTVFAFARHCADRGFRLVCYK